MNLLDLLATISGLAVLILIVYAIWFSHRMTDETRRKLIDSVRSTARRYEVVDTRSDMNHGWDYTRQGDRHAHRP